MKILNESSYQYQKVTISRCIWKGNLISTLSIMNSYINNQFHFHLGLKAWQVYVDIQPVFNEYKAVAYMCQCCSKTDDKPLQAIKKAAKQTFENNMRYHEAMKAIGTGYFSNQECSI